MSRVTDVVVHVDYAPREVEDLLGAPFPFERERRGVGLRRLTGRDDHLEYAVGGSKAFEGEIYAGAFNHLDVDEMVEWFSGLPWDEVGSAVLSSSTQGETYRVVVVRDGKVSIV